MNRRGFIKGLLGVAGVCGGALLTAGAAVAKVSRPVYAVPPTQGIWVDFRATHGNPTGSIDRPFRSIADAIRHASGRGVTIYIRSNTIVGRQEGSRI